VRGAEGLSFGNPSALDDLLSIDYYYDSIILEDDTAIEIPSGYTALFINGTLVTEYEAIIRNDRSLVPVRLINEELGAAVGWDGVKREVTIDKGDTGILLSIDKDKALVNGKQTMLDYPAIICKDRTYVPLRLWGNRGLGDMRVWLALE
jgi:hypothetical protein